jgi:hypothetical protein
MPYTYHVIVQQVLMEQALTPDKPWKPSGLWPVMEEAQIIHPLLQPLENVGFGVPGITLAIDNAKDRSNFRW